MFLDPDNLKWARRALCNICGTADWRSGTTAHFANDMKAVCKKCGAAGHFDIVVARWSGNWWNPLSWVMGHWEKQEVQSG